MSTSPPLLADEVATRNLEWVTFAETLVTGVEGFTIRAQYLPQKPDVEHYKSIIQSQLYKLHARS